MKKLCLIALILSFVYSYGQSIQLIYQDTIVNPDTILVDVRGQADYYLDLVNSSNREINLMITREIIDILPNAGNYFCFYDCLPSTENRLPKAHPFPAGDTFSNKRGDYLYFYTDYDPYGDKGISLIKFNFFDNVNRSDTSSVVFKFNSNALGIRNNQIETVSLKAYPNPATSKVSIQYDLKNQTSKARILVSNIMGVTVKSIPINSTNGKTQIDVSGLASGIYFYSLEVNGKTSATKKLIVK